MGQGLEDDSAARQSGRRRGHSPARRYSGGEANRDSQGAGAGVTDVSDLSARLPLARSEANTQGTNGEGSRGDKRKDKSDATGRIETT